VNRKNLVATCALVGAILLGVSACGSPNKNDNRSPSIDATVNTKHRDDLLSEQIDWVAEQESLIQKLSAQEASGRNTQNVPDAGYSRVKPYQAESYDILKRDGVTYFQTGCDDGNGIEGTRPLITLSEGMLWLDKGYELLLRGLRMEFSELEEGHFINEGSLGKDNMPGQEIEVQRVNTWSSGTAEDDAVDTDEVSVSIQGACIPFTIESD